MTNKNFVYTDASKLFKDRLEKLENRILFYDDMYADMKVEVLEDIKLIDNQINFIIKEFKFTYRMMILSLLAGATQFCGLLYLIGG